MKNSVIQNDCRSLHFLEQDVLNQSFAFQDNERAIVQWDQNSHFFTLYHTILIALEKVKVLLMNSKVMEGFSTTEHDNHQSSN